MRLSLCLSTLLLAASTTIGLPSGTHGGRNWRRSDLAHRWDKIVTRSELPNHQLRAGPVEGVCDAGVKQISGYLDTAEDKHFFYWLFEAQSKPKDASAPLVVWLNGGPGCSSMTGALTELGPCLVSDDGTDTVVNEYGWNQKANLMFVDQPTNVGFSYGSDVADSHAGATDFVALLQLFCETYPEYCSSGIHVFGESYAGHYIPAIGAAILDHNANLGGSEKELPLKSIGIGNGYINPRNQYKYAAKMACNSTYAPVLSQKTCAQMSNDFKYCAQKIDDCDATQDPGPCIAATGYCNGAITSQYTAEDVYNNPYDVRAKCEIETLCYKNIVMSEKFLNSTAIQQALHTEETSFAACSADVQGLYIGSYDYIQSFEDELVKIAESGIRTLIYNGDADWMCNWYGAKSSLSIMKWSGQPKFNSVADVPWVVGSAAAGEARVADNLTFLRVFEAGHMMPMDQPEHALDMLNRWLAGETFA